MHLKLSRRTLKRVARSTALVAGVLGLCAGLYRLGRQVTPAAGADRPVIYSPAVRRTEAYRRKAAHWLDALRALDAALVGIVTADQGDVYALAEGAGDTLDAALRLNQGIGLVYPPASLVSLQRGLQESADLYLEAALAVNLWVGEPTHETYLAALEALRVARHTRTAVEANPWLAATPSASPVATPTPPASGDPAPAWGE
jgi:hypothetical protein